MIEKNIIDFLSARVSDEVMLMRTQVAPERFYLIEKTGSSVENHVYASTIAIQSYAPTLQEAATMSDLLIRLMLNSLPELPNIYGVSLNAEYNYTDTATKTTRYQAVFDVYHADERSN